VGEIGLRHHDEEPNKRRHHGDLQQGPDFSEDYDWRYEANREFRGLRRGSTRGKKENGEKRKNGAKIAQKHSA